MVAAHSWAKTSPATTTVRVRERFSSVSLGALLSELFLAADANSKMCGASRRFLPRRSPVTARIRSLGLIDLSKNRFDMS